MYCPEYKAEYLPGIAVCAGCRVPLVETLPVIDHEKAIEYEEILRTYNQGDIALIRSMLDDARIEYLIQDEAFNQLNPLIQPARLLVRKDQVAEAREVLKSFDITFLGVSGDSEE